MTYTVLATTKSGDNVYFNGRGLVIDAELAKTFSSEIEARIEARRLTNEFHPNLRFSARKVNAS